MTSFIESIYETAQVQLMIPSLKSPATKCFVGSRVVCRRPRSVGDLGRCYADGEGPIEQNHALASTWVSKAVERGDVRAEGFLGVLYHAGKGVQQDDALAVAWWEKAALGVDVPCQCSVCLGYLKGRFGLTKNAHCAKIYMMAAAAQGDARAIEDLKLLNACAACGAPDASRTCQGGRSAASISTARYCTPACPAAHWKAHEPHCGPCQCH